MMVATHWCARPPPCRTPSGKKKRGSKAGGGGSGRVLPLRTNTLQRHTAGPTSHTPFQPQLRQLPLQGIAVDKRKVKQVVLPLAIRLGVRPDKRGRRRRRR